MKLILPILLILTLGSKANRLIVGGGSSLSVNSMAGLKKGDTIAVRSGYYSTAGYSNLHDVTIINYGGVVTFGMVYWGSNDRSSDMHNVHFTGTGSKDFYGFVCNGTSSQGQIYVTLKHTDSLRMDHIDFEGASGNGAVNFSDNYFSVSYDGTVTSTKLHCATFSDIKVNNCSMFLIMGWNCITCPGNNLFDSIDMHNIIASNTSGNGAYVQGSVTHLNAYNWDITYQGYNTNSGDVGVFYIGGNGAIHHCYMRGGRGYLARINAFSLKPFKDSVLFYSNILLSTSTYGGLDIRCDSAAINWTGNPYIWGIKNTYVLNNTVGNKKTDNNYVTPVVLIYNMDIPGTAIIVKNNLSFNDNFNNCCNASLPGNAIVVNYNGATGKLDSSNNYYLTASSILSQLQDTVKTCMPKPESFLNTAGVFYPNIGLKKPTQAGAVTYASPLPGTIRSFNVVPRLYHTHMQFSWTTSGERNVDSFYVQQSRPGENWMTIIGVPSKHKNGNSDIQTVYGPYYHTENPVMEWMGVSLLGFLVMLLFRIDKKKLVLIWITAILIICIWGYKSSITGGQKGNLYFRIMEIDKAKNRMIHYAENLDPMS